MRVFSACHSHGGTHILDTVRHVPTHLSSPALRAQVILRRFASATNLLICGQRFLIICGIDEATATHLHHLLCRLGAFPELLHPLTSHRDRWLPSGDRAAVSAMQYATSTDPCVDAGDKTAKEADPCVDQDVSPVATTDPCVDRDDVGGLRSSSATMTGGFARYSAVFDFVGTIVEAVDTVLVRIPRAFVTHVPTSSSAISTIPAPVTSTTVTHTNSISSIAHPDQPPFDTASSSITANTASDPHNPSTANTASALLPGDPRKVIRIFSPDGHELHDPHSRTPNSAIEYLTWARRHMPVTSEAAKRLKASGVLQGRSIGLSLVLEPKTAVLAMFLAEAGATVSVFGHAQEIREDAAYLKGVGIPVFGASTATRQEETEYATAFLAQQLDVLLDDGSHLIRLAHDSTLAPGALDNMVGAAEETTSGLRPLRDMDSARTLRIPVIASNDARSKTLFDNAYGTGQSCLFTILDLIDPHEAGVDMARQRVLVIGYGDVGKGFARLSRAMGAAVCVADTDPVRALQARLDGFEVDEAPTLASRCTWIISATGVRHTIDELILQAAPNEAVCAVIGGVAQEIAIDQTVVAGAHMGPSSMRAVDTLTLPNGKRLTILDKGGCINCTAGEGNPIEIMDLSFGVQSAAIEYLLSTELEPGVIPVPDESDRAVAALALNHMIGRTL